MTISFTPEYCDAQYNPYRLAIPEYPGIVSEWSTRSQRARDELAVTLDVSYGASDGERLDIFAPKDASGPSPVLFFIHGGYWMALDKETFGFPAPAFTSAGAIFVSVEHTLAPHATLEEIVAQVRRAAAWLYRNAPSYGGDPARIFASGHSAGGHLVGMLMTTDWPQEGADLPRDLIKGGFSISGLPDLEALRHCAFVNDVLKLDAERALALSPIAKKPSASSPLYTAVGGAETHEYLRQNAIFGHHWSEVFVEDVPMPGLNHLTVIDKFGEPGGPLTRAALRMMGLDSRE